MSGQQDDLRKLPDLELVRMLQAAAPPPVEDQREVFAVLADRHYQDVLGFLSRFMRHEPDAIEDVLQDTFMDAFRALPQQNWLTEPRPLGGWLVNMAKNRARKHWDSNRSREHPFGEGEVVREVGRQPWDQPPVRDPETLAAVRELYPEVRATFETTDLELLDLRTNQGLTAAEAGDRLGIPRKTASNRSTEIEKTFAKRLRVLLLIKSDRTRCPELTKILDSSAETGYTTDVYRLVVEHYSTCPTCGNCTSCQRAMEVLVYEYTPVIFFVLLVAASRRRALEAARQVGYQTSPAAVRQPPSPPTPPALPGALPGTGTSRTVRRRTTAAATVLVLIIAVAIVWWQYPRSTALPRPVAAESQLAFATPTGVDIVSVTGTPRQVAPVPAGRSVSSLFWSPDGRQLAWTTSTTATGADITQVLNLRTNTTWSCACAALGFQAGSLIALDPTDPADTPTPHLLIYTAGASKPTRTAVRGLEAPKNPGNGTATHPLGMASALRKMIIGYSPQLTSVYGGQIDLYLVDATGQATFLAHAKGNSIPYDLRISPDGKTLGYMNNVGAGVCAHEHHVFLLNLATGSTSAPKLPVAPHLWYVNGLWFDRANVAHAELAAGPALDGAACSGNNPDETISVTPHDYRDVNGVWTATQTSAKRAESSADGWVAIQTGTVSAGITGIVLDAVTQAPGALTIAKDGRTITLASNATTFAWRPL